MPHAPPSRSAAAALRIAPIVAFVLLAAPAAAQREVEEHDFGDGQGRLVGFYSAVLTFTPTGAPLPAAPGALRVGLDVSYIPRLSLAQRRVGDKPEATNLAPLFPRPRLVAALPGGLSLEASWIPPVRFFDVKANVVSAALSRSFVAPRAVIVTPRVAVTRGWVEGAITCYEDLESGSQDLREYYSVICHGNESEDRFEPRHFTGELLISRLHANGRFAPYLGAGVRHDRTRFDIGVITSDGSRDEDQPILELRATRAHLLAGADWRLRPRLRAGGEAFWAPGSIFTFRLHGSIDVLGR